LLPPWERCSERVEMKRPIVRVSALLAACGMVALIAAPASLATPLAGTTVSRSLTPFAKVPGAPTRPVATAGNALATVRWTAPRSNGGSAILKYTVFSNPGSKTCSTPSASTRTCTVRGLTNLITYTFKVRAINAEGRGPASVASNAVKPHVPVASELVGMWLGPPVPAQSQSCGSGYSQWQFTANGEVMMMMATGDCGGYSMSGAFSIVGANTLWIRITNTGTSYPPPAPFAAGAVTFVSANTFEIYDGSFSYTFNRQ
jgi:hypothetical protein